MNSDYTFYISDEKIVVAQLNRSLTLGKKKYDCSFLEDKSDWIRETFVVPSPSNLGLPDDGTAYKVSKYDVFLAVFYLIRMPLISV